MADEDEPDPYTGHHWRSELWASVIRDAAAERGLMVEALVDRTTLTRARIEALLTGQEPFRVIELEELVAAVAMTEAEFMERVWKELDRPEDKPPTANFPWWWFAARK